jgi:DNA-binding MarR family transcriptional regulator
VDFGAIGMSDQRAQSPEIAVLAENFVSLMRSFNRARAQFLTEAEHDVEWSAHLLLKCIANSATPIRSGALAEALHSDPSTVSRQVAALVKEGYLERRADPEDGRASLLALTESGEDLLAEHDRIRLERFALVVDDWSDADVKRFSTLLQRFTQNYDAMNTNWIAERLAATRSARAGSKH